MLVQDREAPVEEAKVAEEDLTGEPCLPDPQAEARLERARWLSFAAATTGTFMVNVDTSVVNVALPVMQHEFGISIATLQWVITAYLLVITALLPLTGHLADRLGRREVFAAGLVVFVLGSVASALAPDFHVLVAARVLQGIGGAVIMANVMAIVALLFPVERRGQALGLIGSVVAAGTLTGPPLGGLLTSLFGWRAIFWINVPVGLWGVVGSLRYLPRFPRLPGRLQDLDWRGAALFALAISMLQLGLSLGVNWQALLLLLLTAGLTVLFVRAEVRREHALIPLRLLAIPAFSLNLISGMAYWVLMMFPSFLMPFYLHVEEGLPVGLIGLSLVPQALAMIVVSPFGGRLIDRVGVLWPGRVGLFLFMLADVLTGLLPRHAPLVVVWGLIALMGVAAGLYSSPNNAAVLGAVPKADTGIASSLLATQRNLGRAVGVALASILLSLFWILAGLGPTPSHTAPGYPVWFLGAFHGVFLTSAAFGVLALLTFRAPSREDGAEGGRPA